MLSSGYALAGSSYATTGWAIHEGLPDQIAVLDLFKLMVGHPKRTIAWGHSLGGIITAGLIQRHPGRFDAALAMCGVLSGGVATWNTALDSEFAFKTLLAPGTGLQLVNIADPLANLQLAEGIACPGSGHTSGEGAHSSGRSPG
jgi:pimeloyl-ACP methyl ester carboxylesterase